MKLTPHIAEAKKLNLTSSIELVCDFSQLDFVLARVKIDVPFGYQGQGLDADSEYLIAAFDEVKIINKFWVDITGAVKMNLSKSLKALGE